MMADVAEKRELASGNREEGTLYSLRCSSVRSAVLLNSISV